MTTSLQQSDPRAFIIFLAKSDRADVIAINSITIRLDFQQRWQKIIFTKFLHKPQFIDIL